MTLAQALDEAAALGLSRLDAQWLLLHALGRGAHERAWLLAHDHEPLPDDAARAWPALCRQRADGQPLAYLTGHKEFYGLDLQVGPQVLVPRPDTEILVDWALDCLQGLRQPRVLDLGTGSGAIALAIASQRPDARVTAVDASAAALAMAQANARRLGLALHGRLGHWLEGLEAERFDLVVSNPPYIAAGDPHLPALAAEPVQALVSGADGLDDLRQIIAAAPAVLAEGAWLLLEHGHDQSEAVAGLLAARGFGPVAHRKDLAGIGRCTGAAWRTMK